MPKKKQTNRINLLWWIVGGIVVIATMLIIFSNKSNQYIGDVGTVVYETSSFCQPVDSTTIICNCDVIIGDTKEPHKFSNKISATSCDNNICNDLCTNYANELVNK